MRNYEKSNAANHFNTLGKQKRANAITNAEKSIKESAVRKNPNPSTNLHLLMKRFEELSTPSNN